MKGFVLAAMQAVLLGATAAGLAAPAAAQMSDRKSVV